VSQFLEEFKLKNPIIKLEGIEYSYPNGPLALQGINLTLAAGERICILGANGSGKSTLQKIMCGLLLPDQGRYFAFGEEITAQKLEDDRFAKLFHKRIGFIFQNADAQLFMHNVWDEIAFGLLQLCLPPAEVKRRVTDILKMFKLEHLAERPPYTLSGGEKKKVAIAAVLAVNPEVLILDEPVNGLDPKTQCWLVHILNQLHQAGKTIITATHNLELVSEISDRCLVFSEEHRIVADAPPATILADQELLVRVNLIAADYHLRTHRGQTYYYLHNY